MTTTRQVSCWTRRRTSVSALARHLRVGWHRLWRAVRGEAETTTDHEFLTAMWFHDWNAVARFTGGNPHDSVVPPRARGLLSRYDAHSRHYELRRRHR